MKKIARFAFAVGLTMAMVTGTVEAKNKKQLSSLELQAFQSHDFEGTKQLVFGSVMTVLQDSGYRVEQGNLETGLITGIGTGKSHLTFVPFVGFGRSKKTPAVTAFIEQIGQTTHVRLNFVMAKISQTGYGTSLGDEEAILDQQIYADAFEKIGQALFVRQSMAAGSNSPVPSPKILPPPVAPVAAATMTGTVPAPPH